MPSARAGTAPATASRSAANAASQLDLLHQRIEEAVMPSVREQLARWQVVFVVDRRKAQAHRVPMALQKPRYLFAVLLVKYGTRCVQQFTTTRERLPQCVEHAGLLVRELRNVGFASQPLDVRMAPHHARRAAGSVEQDALEWRAVPPCRGVACITAHDARRE